MCFRLHDGRAFTPHARALGRRKHISEAGTEQAASGDHCFANSDRRAITGLETPYRAGYKGLRALRRGTR